MQAMAYSDSDSDVSIPQSIVPYDDGSAVTPLHSNAPNNRNDNGSSSFTSNLDAKARNRRPQQHYADDDGDDMNENTTLNQDRRSEDQLLPPRHGHGDNPKGDDTAAAADEYLFSPIDSQERQLLGNRRQSFDSAGSDQGFREFKWRRVLGRLIRRHLARFCRYLLSVLLVGALFVSVFYGDIKQSMYGRPGIKYVSDWPFWESGCKVATADTLWVWSGSDSVVSNASRGNIP